MFIQVKDRLFDVVRSMKNTTMDGAKQVLDRIRNIYTGEDVVLITGPDSTLHVCREVIDIEFEEIHDKEIKFK